MQESPMVKDADVVVIGSDGFGAATAYFLMRYGVAGWPCSTGMR